MRIITEQRWKHFFEDRNDVDFIPADFFAAPLAASDERLQLLKGSMLVISNTPPQHADAIQSLVNFYNICQQLDQTLIVVWDWDNHHHLHISSILAAVADVYLPTHRAHDFELTSFCDYVWRLPLSSIQWTDGFITDHADRIASAQRRDDFGGTFCEYGMFPLRNAHLRQLQQHLPRIQLVENLRDYWELSPLERLDDWTRHKGQWIVPTLNDLSTRVFDALITGNIIAIPRRFQFDEVLADLNSDDYVCYDENDLIDPQRVKQSMIQKFDHWRSIGIHRRIRFGLDNNLDKRMQDIIQRVHDTYLAA